MNDTKNTPKERAAAFVAALRRARDDRGKMAALRRGLTDNPRMHVDAWPVVAGLGGDIGKPAHVAIAALFATHPVESAGGNFGEACHAIATSGGPDVPDSFERRFRRLLACGGVEEVVAQLRSWIQLAAAKGVGVNYEGLFADLANWPHHADDIRVKWARGFWKSGRAARDESETQNTTTP